MGSQGIPWKTHPEFHTGIAVERTAGALMMIHDVFDDVEAETDLGRAVFPFFSSLIKAGPDLGKLREKYGFHSVCGKPLCRQQRKELLFQDLLYVYSKACHADP